jgi:hypothetical protein
MRIATIITVSLLATAVLLATDAGAEDEIYRWVDANGVIHFGDQPPGNVAAEQIIILQEKPDAATSTSGSGLELEKAEQALEEESSYAQQRRDDRAKKRQEAAEEQHILTEACAQRKALVSQLEPSPRVIVENEDGSIVRMDDNERLELLSEAKTFIAANCKP